MSYLNSKLVLKTPPATEPVTLAEAKLHCRVDASDDDAWFNTAIAAARSACETQCRRAFITQVWTLYLDRFPGASSGSSWASESPTFRDKRAIRMPMPPLASVASITYVDVNGATQTLAANKYQVDDKDDPGVIVPAYGESWPDTRDQLNAVAIEFTAGQASNLDPRVKQGVLMLVAHWYENRETVVVGAMTREIEMAVCYLMGQMWNGTLR